MKFLTDECLSPELVAIARRRRYGESTHVTWLGMRSRRDWTIVRRAVADGHVLVTNNTTDFRAPLGREEVHAGPVCINVASGLMSLDVQKRLFAFALDRLGHNEPVNELLTSRSTNTGPSTSSATIFRRPGEGPLAARARPAPTQSAAPRGDRQAWRWLPPARRATR